MWQREEMITYLQQLLPKVLDQRPVCLAYLHGSVARGRTTPLSDVDIALITEESLSPLARLDLELDIEVALAERNLTKSDVRIINDAPGVVQGRVVTEGVLIYCRDEQRRIAFERASLSRYSKLQSGLKREHWTYFQARRADLEDRGLYGR